MTRRNWLPLVIALLSLASSPVRAQLAHHVHLQELAPRPAEAFSPLNGERQANEFGSDVVVRNGLAFVGMPAAMSTGKVAEFTRRTSGWVRTATIVASDRTTGDGFGQSVSHRDGLLVVGSGRAVYIYKRVDGVWREKQKIVPPAADGLDVVRDLTHEAGVLAFVASSSDFRSSDFRHALFVYEQDANGRFVRRAQLMTSDNFPWSIDMNKAIIVAGTQGAAYIFGRNSSGQWVKRQQLIASSRTNPYDGFGRVVAVDNHMILVSAPDDPSFDDSTGEVYVFLPAATGYVEAFKLPVRGGTAFGSALAISDKYIAVGSAEIGFVEDNPPGFIVTYLREGSTVRPLGYIVDTDLTPARRPTSIDIADNLLLVGSAFDESCSHFDDFCEHTGINIGEANLLRLNQFKP